MSSKNKNDSNSVPMKSEFSQMADDFFSGKPLRMRVSRYEYEQAAMRIIPTDFGDDMFDPTGFVPLKVMIEQQRAAGANALLQRAMFDFEDWEDIYLETEKPDFSDDFAVMEYIQEIERKKSELLQARQKELSEEFAEFMQSKASKNASVTTNLNDDADANTASTVEPPPKE